LVAPLSQMPGDLKRRVDKIDRAIKTHETDMLRAGAMAAKDAHLDVMKHDAGGDLTLSRVRSGRGAKVGVSFTIQSHEAIVKATGPLPLLANPIKPHVIPKQRGRRRRVIAIPGIGVRASAQHPGTKGKDTWTRGREKAAPKVKVAIAKRSDEVVRRAFLSGG